MRLIKIPDDGIVRVLIVQEDNAVGERCIDLSRFPTIDAEPVRHGQWIIDKEFFPPTPLYKNGRWRTSVCCSECDLRFSAMDADSSFIREYKTNYCPDCGAKMDL